MRISAGVVNLVGMYVDKECYLFQYAYLINPELKDMLSWLREMADPIPYCVLNTCFFLF